jgi:O-antigen ligase
VILASRRRLAVASALLLTVVLAVPAAMPLMHRPALSGISLTVGALFVAALWDPLIGLAALILLAPTATLWVDTSTSGITTDQWVFAFLAGASYRVILARPATPERLRGLLLVLLAAVVASFIVELNAIQRVFPRRSIVAEGWASFKQDLGDGRPEFAFIRHSVRWIGGLLVALYAERAIRQRLEPQRWLMWAWLAAGMVAAFVTATAVVSGLRRTEQTDVAGAVGVLIHTRISALQPDLNAAGSYFCLFLVPAIVIAWRGRSLWMAGIAAVHVVAFWLAKSRAAIGAVVLVLGATAVSAFAGQRRRIIALASVLVAILVLVGALATTRQTHAGLDDATTVRWQLLEVGLQTAKRHMMFGVGLGDYIPMSRRWVTDDMALLKSFAPRGENAHNNYLQILVELGLPATVLFMGLLVVTIFSAWRPNEGLSAQAMGMGLAAFAVSAVFGHPLLLSEVSAAFFLALGLTAGLAAAPGPHPEWHRTASRAGILIYVVSLLWRLG